MKRFAGWFVSAGVAMGALLLLGTLANAAEDASVPPKGSALIVAFAAEGVQVYACEAKDGKFAWTFKAPEAAMFDELGRQAGTHFAGPTWKLADGSALAGDLVSKADAQEAGAIPWLLLHGKNHEGKGTLSDVTYIRRTDTKGGAAPKMGCDASHMGEQARMHYTANYQFFSAPK